MNNKNKKSVKFQGDMLNFYDFIQVFVFTTNHHLNLKYFIKFKVNTDECGINRYNMVCPPLQRIIHLVKLVDYLFILCTNCGILNIRPRNFCP